MRKIIIHVFFIVFSFLLSLFILELFLRFLGNKKQLELEWLLKENDYWKIDPDFIFTTTDVQDRLSELKQHEGGTEDLIFAIGDSFTKGDPDPQEIAYTKFLQEKLITGTKSAQVINLGVGGYGSDQEFLLLKKVLENDVTPKVVIWQFYFNDLYENMSLATFDTSTEGNLEQLDGASNWAYRRQLLYDLIPLSDHIKRESFLVNNLLYAFDRYKDVELKK